MVINYLQGPNTHLTLFWAVADNTVVTKRDLLPGTDSPMGVRHGCQLGKSICGMSMVLSVWLKYSWVEARSVGVGAGGGLLIHSLGWVDAGTQI